MIAGGGGGGGDAGSARGGDNQGNATGENGGQSSGPNRAGKGATSSAGGAAGAGGSTYGDDCNGFGPSLKPGAALSGGDAGYTCSSVGARTWNPTIKPSLGQGGAGRGGFEPGGYVGGGGGGGGYFGGGGGAAGSWTDGGAGGGAGISYAKTGTTSNVSYYNGDTLKSGAGWASSTDGTGNPSNGAGEAGKVYLAWTATGVVTSGQDLIMQSIGTTAATVPSTTSLSILMEDGLGVATLNTDIKGYVSRDGGTTWTQGTLLSDGSWGTNKKTIYFDGLDISSQPSGTSMRYKITTHTQSGVKETRLHSVSLSWA